MRMINADMIDMKKLADTFDKWGLDDEKKNIIYEIIRSGEKVHNCKNCTHADYMTETNRVYCLLHSCVMTLDNCCRDWEDDDE